MATARITDTSVRDLSGKDGEAYLWDDQLRGFGVRATAGRKTFIVKYSLGGRNARQRKFKIGVFGTLNSTQAREQAKAVLAAVALGKDPAGDREANRNDLTVSAALHEFLKSHVDAKRATRTADEYRRLMDKIVKPKIGTLRISEVKTADISRLHRKLSETPVQANRVLAILSKFFNWCETNGMRARLSNPCAGIEKNVETARDRFLTAEEIQRLGSALAASAEYPSAIAAIRLLMLTGARKNEILTLKWEQVDLKRGLARIDAKAGPRNLFLPAPAQEVMADLKQKKDNPYVVHGRSKYGRLVGLQKIWERVRDEAKLPGVRLHDLRHTHASIAVQGNASLKLIGGVLGHRSPLTTNRYAHLGQDPAAALAERVGSQIAAIAMPKKAAS